MSDIQNKLTNYLNAVKAKAGHPGWLEYPIKTPLSKNSTITEWNAIVEDIRELASDDEATVAFIEHLTEFVNQLHSRVSALSTQISSKSQAYLYNTFTDFISDLISGINVDINQGDTVFTLQSESPDFIVVDSDVALEYLPNAVPIPDINSIPTSSSDPGVIYFVANKYYIMAIESGVSAPDLGIDSELDLYSPRAVMNSVITAAIQNLYDYFSGYTAKVDENTGRINDLKVGLKDYAKKDEAGTKVSVDGKEVTKFNADTKVDKITQATASNVYVYTTDFEYGTQNKVHKLGNSDGNYVAYNIPMLYGEKAGEKAISGYLLTNTPKNNYHAANKQYVDDSIAQAHSILHTVDMVFVLPDDTLTPKTYHIPLGMFSQIFEHTESFDFYCNAYAFMNGMYYRCTPTYLTFKRNSLYDNTGVITVDDGGVNVAWVDVEYMCESNVLSVKGSLNPSKITAATTAIYITLIVPPVEQSPWEDG